MDTKSLAHTACHLLIIVALILSFSYTAYAQTENFDDCNVKKSNARLAETYNKVLKQYADDDLFIKNLQFSQQTWLAYRDAQVKALYPHTERGYYGSIFSQCKCDAVDQLTQARIKELEIWLNGTEEGDSCAGSVKTKH